MTYERPSNKRLLVLSDEAPVNPSRRNFLGAVGATVAGATLSGCIRKPVELILPYSKRPEDLIPGKPTSFATAMNIGGSVLGVLVESTDGRPTKIEGNPDHPMSRGRTHVWAQASVLDLYDPDRSKFALKNGQRIDAAQRTAEIAAIARAIAEDDGRSLAVVVDDTPSPTLNALLGELVRKYPQVQICALDSLGSRNGRGPSNSTTTFFGKPRTILAVDSDYLFTEGDSVANSLNFAEGRKPETDTMSRLYAVEGRVSLTGSLADHRLALSGALIAEFLVLVAEKLQARGHGPEIGRKADRAVFEQAAKVEAFADAVAEDLLALSPSLIVVGDRQPKEVHELGHRINLALGNVGQTVRRTIHELPYAMHSMEDLAKAIGDGRIKQLVMLGTNPAYHAPAALGFEGLLKKVSVSIHLGSVRDESGELATIHIPMSHYLEAWGDLRARDGTVSIQQPLIAPLYESMSPIEVVAALLGKKPSGHEWVREGWRSLVVGDFEPAWRRWLAKGVVDLEPRAIAPEESSDTPIPSIPAFKRSDGLELEFSPDASVLDGRFANNPWLQELPDPITKLTWDNAAVMSPKTAAKLSAKNGDVVRIEANGRDIKIPAWILPGTADNVVVLPLGYGRKFGTNARMGVNVASLRSNGSFVMQGAKATKTGETAALATTQTEPSAQGRPHVRVATLLEFVAQPKFVEKGEVIGSEHIHSMWEEPKATDPHQWGMTIDLNRCTGCSACTIACQAENNIPWVGKSEVMNGRELHWIRLDRYYESGSTDDLSWNVQPMACTQCETAPCENVCPVTATAHSPDGLNDMAYNRCIGTRYCANNCPYKVRRFNFFHYAKQNDEEYGALIAMQRNPNVTVRFRGVMEKCTYCVQRVNEAKIKAKRERPDGVVRDGEVTPACAQACPADAIVFGNIADPKSRVSQSKNESRNYAVLSELNIRPRTTYLARIRNRNPKLG